MWAASRRHSYSPEYIGRVRCCNVGYYWNLCDRTLVGPRVKRDALNLHYGRKQARSDPPSQIVHALVTHPASLGWPEQDFSDQHCLFKFDHGSSEIYSSPSKRSGLALSKTVCFIASKTLLLSLLCKIPSMFYDTASCTITRQLCPLSRKNSDYHTTKANKQTNIIIIITISIAPVPKGSPSQGGDIAVYVFDRIQPSLPTPFYSVLVSISVFMALSIVFYSIILLTTVCFPTLFF